MAIRIETGSKQRCRVIVDGNMTIYEAAADKSMLLDALVRARETDIDLSLVSELDTAGLQLLILAKRESLKAGTVMRLAAHSPVSLDVVERYGLAGYFAQGAGANTAKSATAAPSRAPKKRGPKAKARQRRSDR